MNLKSKLYSSILFNLFCGLSLYAQVPNAFYQSKVNLVNQQTLTNNLSEFENLGVKSVGTTAQENTYQWLKNKYLSFGYTESQINTYTYTYSNKSNKNIEVVKQGSVYPNEYVLVCGHFDTKNGPGVNDNGSGVVTILEIARILQNIQTDYSIRFINFSGEEDGLYGSRSYVSQVVNSTNPKMKIRVLLNIDEVGGVANAVNDKVKCERDLTNPTTNNAASLQFTNDLMSYVSAYSTLTPVLSNAYSSDYMPFQSNGEIITGLFEYNESRHPHTATDRLVNMDPVYNFQIAKASTAAILHYAIARENLHVEESKSGSLLIYPNPSHEKINFEIPQAEGDADVLLYDTNGRKVLDNKIVLNQSTGVINTQGLQSGLYVLKIMLKSNSYQQKVFIN